MKFKELLSRLFFGRRENVIYVRELQPQRMPEKKASRPTRKRAYDLSGLPEKVWETEYITNLRIGRSWILPQLVRMGFRKGNRISRKFDIKQFEEALLERYNCSTPGREEVWNLLKRNYKAIASSGGTARRTAWWTKELLQEMMEWDFSLVGKASSGLDRRKCIEIISTLPDLTDPAEISRAVEEYDRNRMRKRDILHYHPLPESFVNAFEGDGAYNAMMTMVKVFGARINDTNGNPLTRDGSVREIESQAATLNGRQLLEYCKERFFDSGAFDYKKYLTMA